MLTTTLYYVARGIVEWALRESQRRQTKSPFH